MKSCGSDVCNQLYLSTTLTSKSLSLNLDCLCYVMFSTTTLDNPTPRFNILLNLTSKVLL